MLLPMVKLLGDVPSVLVGIAEAVGVIALVTDQEARVMEVNEVVTSPVVIR